MGALGADFYNLTFFSSRPRYIFPDDLAQPVGQFLVNFSPVTDGEDPDDTRLAIQFVLVVADLNPRMMAPTDCDGDRNVGRMYSSTLHPETL